MKKIARVIGLLFFVSTCSYLIGSGMVEPVLNQPEFLSSLYVERAKVGVGVFLQLINAMAVVGIAMFIYPILRKYNEPFTIGYLTSRIIESVLLIISAAAPLVLIMLSKQSSALTDVESTYFIAAGNVLLDSYSLFFQMAMIVLSLGSLLLCIVLYQTRLIPRLLSTIGVIGYVALFISSCLEIFSEKFDFGAWLYIPGAIFEVIFPVWLIIKGFNVIPKEKG